MGDTAGSTPAEIEHMWVIEKIEISGGFLPGLSVNILSVVKTRSACGIKSLAQG
jgi:hypothetical protein